MLVKRDDSNTAAVTSSSAGIITVTSIHDNEDVNKKSFSPLAVRLVSGCEFIE